MTILPKFHMRPCKKRVSWRRRHHASTALTRILARRLKNIILTLCKGMEICKTRHRSRLKKIIAMLLVDYDGLTCVEPQLTAPLAKIERKNRTIDSFRDDQCHMYFRFETRDKLHRVFRAFQFPRWFRDKQKHKYSGEEVFLVGLYRMRNASSFGAACWEYVFGMTYNQAGSAFQLFLHFMFNNWGYLLTNNVTFWIPYLPMMAVAIRNKLAEKGVVFPHPLSPGGFRVFGFIDNTMNSTCRPGGGPARDGTNAPRNDPLIQRAFYNGWKKLHSLKWQTVDLPNGMNFHAWGPCSGRHNDQESLEFSRLNEILVDMQQGEALQWMIYGDSAYINVPDTHILCRHSREPNTPRQVAENKAMSSCRELIEWDYGDVGRYWNLVDYKKVLKMRKMRVDKMYLVAMVLRNAYVTVSANNTAETFDCPPPSLEEWVRSGPNARPANYFNAPPPPPADA